MGTWNKLSHLDKEDILRALGLQPKRSSTEYLLPVLGIFSVGLLVGVGVGMLAAPKAGHEIREDLTKQARHVRDRAKEMAEEAVSSR